VVGNTIIADEIRRAKKKVNMGESLANAFKDCKEFPPLVIRMIAVGESTGGLGETVGKVSSYYDSEVPKTIDQVFTLMEPLMIVIMGVGVGFVAFSIFLPMFNMVNAAKTY
jgi:type IV pilus assembly protein PilC